MTNILVVQDNIENMELIKCLLEMKGYKYEVAMDGEKALELANKYSLNLIILDIQLPIVNGFEVLNGLKNTMNSNTPVIAVTAFLLDSDEENFLAERRAYHLSKPFSINAFFEATSICLYNNIFSCPSVKRRIVTNSM